MSRTLSFSARSTARLGAVAASVTALTLLGALINPPPAVAATNVIIPLPPTSRQRLIIGGNETVTRSLPSSSTSMRVMLPEVLTEFRLTDIAYTLSGQVRSTTGTVSVNQGDDSVVIPLPNMLFTDWNWRPTDPQWEGGPKYYVLDLTAVGPSNVPGGAPDANKFAATVSLEPTAPVGGQQAVADLRTLQCSEVRYSESRQVPEARAIQYGDSITLAGPRGFWNTMPSKTARELPGRWVDMVQLYWELPAVISTDGSEMTALVEKAENPEDVIVEQRPGAWSPNFMKDYCSEGWNMSQTNVPVYIGPPAAPTIHAPVPGDRQVSVSWTPLEVDAAIINYRIRVFNNGRLESTTTAPATATSAVVTGLSNYTANNYSFDVSGVNAVGIGTPTARTAEVNPRLEFEPPTIITTSPASGATSVSQTATVSAEFSEWVVNVDNTTMELSSDTWVPPASVSFDWRENRATLKPTNPLPADTRFIVTVSGVQDSVGNLIAPTTWNFTTGPAPTIGLTSPKADAADVDPSSTITAAFSEDIRGHSTTTAQVSRVSDGSVVPSSVAFNTATNMLTLDPDATLEPDTEYLVTFNGGPASIRDLADNPLSTRRWTFTTANATTSAPTVNRIAGTDRFDGAIRIAQQAYPNGAPVVYIATGANYPDALSAGAAAAKEGGPLLLTNGPTLSANVRDEILRLNPARIVVTGGPASVSTGVFSALQALVPNTVRVSGADRFATSRDVVRYAFGGSRPDTVYLATGANFPDALSAGAPAGAAKAPVLLIKGAAESVDPTTLGLIRDLAVDGVKIVGGPVSISNGIHSQLAASYAVERFSGADRFETSRLINHDAFPTADRVFLATGSNFPDALAGTAWAGRSTSPLYVVRTECVPRAILDDIAALEAGRVTLLGGTIALTSAVEELAPCS